MILWKKRIYRSPLVSQLVRFARVSSGFNCRNKALTAKLLMQGIVITNFLRHFLSFIANLVGPDQFKPIVLQTLHAELAPILQVIFQKSLDSGKLPYIWKEANVSPIFKTRDKSDPANYRPISLTCVLCKVLEHIVALANSNILFELQHGFREKRSCET